MSNDSNEYERVFETVFDTSNHQITSITQKSHQKTRSAYFLLRFCFSLHFHFTDEKVLQHQASLTLTSFRNSGRGPVTVSVTFSVSFHLVAATDTTVSETTRRLQVVIPVQS